MQGFWTEPYYYLRYLENGGDRTFFYLSEVFGIGGWLLLGVVLLIKLEDHSLLKFLTGIVVTWGILGGLGKYLIWPPQAIGDHLTIFSNQYSMSALLLNSVLFFPLGWALNKKHSFLLRLGGGFLFFTSVMTVFLTRSRGGMVSLLIGTTLFFLLGVYWCYRSLDRTVLVILLAGVLIIILALPLVVEVHPIKQIRELPRTLPNLSGRVNLIWPDSIWLINQEPYFGYPAATFRSTVETAPLHSRADTFNAHPNTHNLFLQVIYDSGLIGASLFLIFLFSFLKFFFRLPRWKLHHVALLVSFLTVPFIHGITESVPYGLFPFYLGLLFLVKPEGTDEQLGIDR